ncbi:MAG: hypothetical protein ACOYU7_08790 [Bacillota bacterium]
MAKTKRNKNKYIVTVISVVSDEEGRQALAEARRFAFACVLEKLRKEKTLNAGNNLHQGIN